MANSLLIEIKNTQPLEKIEMTTEQVVDELQQGYGLENIRKRLELIYGLENILFSIQNNEQHYTVTIHVPA